MTLFLIIVSTVLVAIVSLVGVVLFSFSPERLRKSIFILVALSAGTMFGNALFHLIPEMIELSEEGPFSLFGSLLIFAFAFIVSFQFEQWFFWHHCHNTQHVQQKHPFGHLTLVSDALHNFIDGIIIASTFSISPTVGVITVIAVVLHEAPQELGDYAVLLHAGWERKKALFANFFAASSVIVGGVAGFYLSQITDIAVAILIPFAAGSFLYIATSDLIPELKHQTESKQILLHSGMFLFALAIMILTAFFE